MLREKLLSTSTVLDSRLDVAEGRDAHCRELIPLKATAIGEQFLGEI